MYVYGGMCVSVSSTFTISVLNTNRLCNCLTSDNVSETRIPSISVESLFLSDAREGMDSLNNICIDNHVNIQTIKQKPGFSSIYEIYGRFDKSSIMTKCGWYFGQKNYNCKSIGKLISLACHNVYCPKYHFFFSKNVQNINMCSISKTTLPF